MTPRPACLAAGFIACFLLLSACGADGGSERPVDNGVASRIVTLSPHLAELVIASGAGQTLVGVSAYTEIPDGMRSIPVIGDAFNIDQEALALLDPDLLLAWDTGTPAHVIDELRRRGFRTEVIATTHLSDISAALRTIGRLTGNPGSAGAAADAFVAGVQDIRAQHSDAEPIRVFYQVDARPLYTINGEHFVSELIALCGGVNVFSDLDGLAPLIAVEAVLERDPEVILASTDAGTGAFDEWDRWPDLDANRFGNRFLMPADDIGRPTPRLLVAAEELCEALALARRNRETQSHD